MIKYSLVPNSKAGDLAKFLIEHFFADEPLGLALGLTDTEVRRWYPTYIEYAVTHGLSFMAMDSDTGKMVGAVVAAILDPSCPPTVSMPGLVDAEKEPIMTLICKVLTVNWNSNPRPPKEKTLVYQFLSVDKNYGGKGIGTQLVQQSESRAKENGIRFSLVDTTSYFSYRVFQKAGFDVILEQDYTTIEVDGTKPLESKKEKLGVHSHIRLLSKTL